MNDITALRGHLFETLAALRDPQNPMDIDRAKAINETAQVIINSAKVEVDYAKVSGSTLGSNFLDKPSENGQQKQIGSSATSTTQTGTKTVKQENGATVTTHKLK